MNCDQRQDLMLPYAADVLEEAEQQEIRAHLTGGCARCNAALDEAEAVLQRIPASVDPVAPPPDAVKRLMQDVNAEQAMSAMSQRFNQRIALAACLGLLVGGAIVYFLLHPQRQDLREQLADQRRQLQDLQGMIQSDQMKLIAFTSQDQSAASGRILWDREKGKWHVVVFNLKPPPTGRRYELWFIKPDQTKIAAGMFDTDINGKGATVVKVPPGIGDIAVAAVTDEPLGGVAQPTGSIHLVGNVQ
jgi:hypothetical protein